MASLASRLASFLEMADLEELCCGIMLRGLAPLGALNLLALEEMPSPRLRRLAVQMAAGGLPRLPLETSQSGT